MDAIVNWLKNFFNGENKQKFFLIACIGGVLLFIIVIVFIVFNILNHRISYEALEQKLASVAEQYMNDHPDNFPSAENPTYVVSASTLVENKYLKPLQKYVKDSSCTANVNVVYENGVFLYEPYLTCNSFHTEKLVDELKKDNNISSTGDGLYEMNGEFVYRGQDPHNYLEFAEQIFRIVKVNSEGKIIIIPNELNNKDYGVWDDRYNTETQSQKGVNNLAISRILSKINDIYEERYKEYEKFLTPFTICAGKRAQIDLDNSGAIECATPLTDQKIGLLPLYDVINASLDSTCVNASNKQCQNYNYLITNQNRWWTATADTATTHDVYSINSSGVIVSDDASYSGSYRYTLALSKNILWKSGHGTKTDPYQIR